MSRSDTTSKHCSPLWKLVLVLNRRLQLLDLNTAYKCLSSDCSSSLPEERSEPRRAQPSSYKNGGNSQWGGMINLFLKTKWTQMYALLLLFFINVRDSTWKAFASPRRNCPRILLSLTGKLKGHKLNAEVDHYFLRSLPGIQDTRAVMSVIIIAALN